jgi:hypothetical protein
MYAGEVAEYTARGPLNISLQGVEKTGDADRNDFIESYYYYYYYYYYFFFFLLQLGFHPVAAVLHQYRHHNTITHT